MTRAVVGVDPGGRSCGVVVRRGTELIDFAVLERLGVAELPDVAWLQEVTGAVIDYAETFGALVAIEGVRAPKGFARGRREPISLSGLIGTSMVLGAVLALVPDATVVPPGQMGGAPLSSYPAKLVGERERSGAGRYRHARSAWDIAGFATSRLLREAAS